MRTVCEKDGCCGCMACIDSCPKNAIIIEDTIYAYNAVINEKKCINCNACYQVCQANNMPDVKEPILWRQGWAISEKQRGKSSSGGVATALEIAFIKDGGCVCSCTFNNGLFGFEIIESVEEQARFVGSKYVKSNPIGCYKEIRRRLVKGQKVLFLGLPCQAAAVKNFIGSRLNEKLFTIDLICHGTPSPKILESFLKQYGLKLSNIKTIDFRVKTNFYLQENQKEIGASGVVDKYSMAFLNALCYTENCYKCKYARKERVSDITLGDSWGSELSTLEQKKGISLILCQTEKGRQLLEDAEIDLMEVDIDKAIERNHQLKAPSEKPKKREYFFEQFNKNRKMNSIVRECYPKSSFKQFIKWFLIRLNVLRFFRGGAE